MKCDLCKGRIETKLIPYHYKNKTYLGDFEADVCLGCNKVFFTERGFEKIKIQAKLLKLWGSNQPGSEEMKHTSIVDSATAIITNQTLFRNPFTGLTPNYTGGTTS